MKAVLALLAVLGLPLAVQAQPAADSDKSAEVSELVVQARKATAVSGVAVQGLCPLPGELANRQLYAQQFDALGTGDKRPVVIAGARVVIREIAPTRTKEKRTEESAGTRAFILREIADFRSGAPDYAHMGVMMARVTRDTLPRLQRWIVCRGAFKDIKFLHVSALGDDDFEVDFSNGPIEWEVAPLDSHGLVQQAALRLFYPQPITDQFVDFLKSAEQGWPKYADLSSDAAAAFRGARWRALQAAQEAWGRRKAILFERQASDGSYVYIVTYEARQVVWNVSPLDAEGKFTGLAYAERDPVPAPPPGAVAQAHIP
jgi:hypothetical protein